MPNVEKEINDIKKYFVTWVSEVVLANALNYFDINKVSEGTCQRLLNLIFNYDLKDLNQEKANFPGIDLGDRTHGKLAFQVTSRTDTGKIKKSLKIFADNNWIRDFPNGIRFFIINNDKRPKVKKDDFTYYLAIFDYSSDVLFPADLIRLIEGIYYTNEQRFREIKKFLKVEFGTEATQNLKTESIINFDSISDKLNFFKRLFQANHERAGNMFVPFICHSGKDEIQTNELPEKLFSENGGVIIGPSGCGKSILARKLGLIFLSIGLPVVLESKYYDIDLNTLFEKEIRAYGFESGKEFFAISKERNLPILLIIDGLNECAALLMPKLLIELGQVVKQFNPKVIITSQMSNVIADEFGLIPIQVNYPGQNTKKAIASIYSGKKSSSKLDPILNVISSSLEAKMLGEIGLDDIDKVSRFSLFEIFIKEKLKQYKSEGFLLLTYIAKHLSDQVTFNLSERSMEQLLRTNQLPNNILEKCITAGLLESNLGRFTFSHEMFFNFFVAESVVRFASNVEEIEAQLIAPKNHDKKLLIIGSIDDTTALERVLVGLMDIELLASLFRGDGGEYCRKWVEKHLNITLSKIETEIQSLNFELGADSINGIQFREDTLRTWTTQELSLVHTLPYIFVSDHFLPEFFELIALMDDRCTQSIKDLEEIAEGKNVSLKSSVFSAAYIGFAAKRAAITRIFSDIQSGFTTFRNAETISPETIAKLLSKKSLKPGQFYFLLSILRYNEKLTNLYPYIISLLGKWRSVPYNLTNEVLNQLPYSWTAEEEREELISALNKMHAETKNVWLSTNIFEALSSLGALEDDANGYVETVKDQLTQVMGRPDDADAWGDAAGIYYAQFDHPYDSAFSAAIERLNDADKKLFFKMALQGYHSSMFTTSLVIEAEKVLGKEISPYILRWTTSPFIEESFPHDSLGIFLLVHILLARYNEEITSRFDAEPDKKRKSLFATAELYYWLNRSDLDLDRKQSKCKPAAKVLFDPENAYVIESVWQSNHALHQSSIHNIFEPESIINIKQVFSDKIISACRKTLSNLTWQLEVYGFHRDDEINKHAIWLLESLGNLMDIEILRMLMEDPIYGEAAVTAIKKLSTNN
jgi:hypothetical protein